jgi:hypothetical protein
MEHGLVLSICALYWGPSFDLGPENSLFQVMFSHYSE